METTSKSPILYSSKEECCGCALCYAVCPSQAINMEYDTEGFLYPVIDEHKCIKCKKCLKICFFPKKTLFKAERS